MRLIKRLALFLAVLAVVGILAEVVLQVLWADDEEFEFRFRTGTEVGRDAATPFRLHHERFYTLKDHHREGEHHAGPFATDAWPFRGRPGAPLPPDMPVVAVVGDSCVYGVGLRPSQTLPARLAEELAGRGLPPDRVAVLNFGVTGYSTVQLLQLLREVVGLVRVDALVLYPAAWNDQMAAILEPDHRMIERRLDPTPTQALVRRSRILTALKFWREKLPTEEIIEAWERGEPLRGWRVPSDLVDSNVRTMIAMGHERGAPVVVIVPHQPRITRERYPRTKRDADTVRAAAEAAGALVVDGPAVLRSGGRTDDDNFVDFVHPSPAAVDLLAAAVAENLAPALLPIAREPTSGLRIVSVQPPGAPSFGDVEVTLTLDGWTRDEPLPTVTVGHAPLLGLRALAPDVVAGTLPAHADGIQPVLVQTGTDVARLDRGLKVMGPELSVQLVDGRPHAVVNGRPGDRVRFCGSPVPRDAPKATSIGTWHLPGAFNKPDDASIFALDVEIGPDGKAVAPVPDALLGPDGGWLQARVAPQGESLDDGATSIATEPVGWEGPLGG